MPPPPPPGGVPPPNHVGKGRIEPVAVAALLLCLGGELLALAAMAPGGNWPGPGSGPATGVEWFVAAAFASGALFLGAIRAFARIPRRYRPICLWGGALALRAVAFALVPAATVGGGQRLPAAVFLPVNHWGSAPVARPESLARLARAAAANPAARKLAAAAADLGVLFLVLRLLTGPGRYRDAAWYAWQPLTAYLFAGIGSPDAAVLLAATAALWTMHRADPLDRQQPLWRWAIPATVLLGAASACSLWPVFLFPAFAVALRRKFPLLAVAAAMALASPGRAAPGAKVLAAAVAAVLAAAVCRRDWRQAALWAAGGAVLLLPGMLPWGVIGVLPLACWCRRPAWSVFAVSATGLLLLAGPGAGAGAAPPVPAAVVAPLVLLPPAIALAVAIVGRRLPAPSR